MRGWKVLVALLTLITVFCGVGTWAMITWILPSVMNLDPAWSQSNGDLWPWLAFGGLVAGSMVAFALDYSPLWTNRLPLLSDAGTAASPSSAAIGAVAAAGSFFTVVPVSPLAILIAGSIALIFTALAWRRIRSTIVDVRSHGANRERVKTLRATGTQVQADVVDLHFQHTWLGGDSPVFTVTSECTTPSGSQRGEGSVVTSVRGAPVVGGTVLLWFSGDGSDTSNIDIVQDPSSVLDPDAESTYTAPSA